MLLRLSCALSVAQAQDYPNKPIRVVLTYTAGGVSDGIMRLLAPKMEEMLGQKLIIEAKPGAAGNIGVIEVAKSPPDGYTLVVTAANNFVINQFTMKMPIDPLTALAPVAKLADVPLVLFSNPTIPAKNFAEFMAYVKANPGKVNFGSPAPGTVNQLLLERVKQMRGLDMQHIPYRGSPQGVMALLQNDIQLFTVGLCRGHRSSEGWQVHCARGRDRRTPAGIAGRADPDRERAAGFHRRQLVGHGGAGGHAGAGHQEDPRGGAGGVARAQCDRALQGAGPRDSEGDARSSLPRGSRPKRRPGPTL